MRDGYQSSYELSEISEGGTKCLVSKRGGNKTSWGERGPDQDRAREEGESSKT